MDVWKIWVTELETYFQMFFQIRVGRQSSPGAVFPFAAFRALSISGSLTGIHGIFSLVGVTSSGAGSAILGKKLPSSAWAFSSFWAISLSPTLSGGMLA